MPKSPALQRETWNTHRLDEHASAIRDVVRELRKRTLDDIVVIGGHLISAKTLVGSGWLKWLDQNFGWSERTARRLMQVARQGQAANLADLNVPISSLYQLTAPSTPESAREAIAWKAASGKVKHREVTETIRAAKPAREPKHLTIVPRETKPNSEAKAPEVSDVPTEEFAETVQTFVAITAHLFNSRRVAILAHDRLPPEQRSRVILCLTRIIGEAETLRDTLEGAG